MHHSSLHTYYMPCPSQSSWFDHPNDIWWGIQSMLCSLLHSHITSSLLDSNVLLSALFMNRIQAILNDLLSMVLQVISTFTVTFIYTLFILTHIGFGQTVQMDRVQPYSLPYFPPHKENFFPLKILPAS
jgi:hypothetical protein